MIFILFIVFFVLLKILHIDLIHLLKSIPLIISDFYKFVKFKKWKEFNKFGVEIYTGPFGNGKTLQAVKYVDKLHKHFPDIPIYSNINLHNIPYIKLTSFEQIVDIDDKSIVLIDEMGVMFNNREFGSFPMALLDNILQCRHIGLLIVGTAQKYEDLDVIVRKNVSHIHETKKLCSRLLRDDVYDGYKVYYSDIDYHNLKPDWSNNYFCVTDYYRNIYDTTELAVNITNVIDDDTYVNRKSKVNSRSVNKYNKRYSNKWTVNK